VSTPASTVAWFVAEVVRRGLGRLAGHLLAVHLAIANPVATPIICAIANPVATPIICGLEVLLAHGVAAQGGLFGGQGLAVGDWDLVVVGMDFGERQETVTVAAVFDECGLQRRFDPGDFRQVYVAFKLRPRCRFVVELFDSLAG
jgi:hypothetical protein